MKENSAIFQKRKIPNGIDYDFTWIFLNGNESEEHHKSFKQNLLRVFLVKTSRLLIKESDKDFRFSTY